MLKIADGHLIIGNNLISILQAKLLLIEVLETNTLNINYI